MSGKKPTIGRIVHFINAIEDGAPIVNAAIVIDLDETPGSDAVLLQVFYPDGEGGEADQEEAMEGTGVGDWMWPPRD